jgi:hypothetical protein
MLHPSEARIHQVAARNRIKEDGCAAGQRSMLAPGRIAVVSESGFHAVVTALLCTVSVSPGWTPGAVV